MKAWPSWGTVEQGMGRFVGNIVAAAVCLSAIMLATAVSLVCAGLLMLAWRFVYHVVVG